jgi:hypothetical protein
MPSLFYEREVRSTGKNDSKTEYVGSSVLFFSDDSTLSSYHSHIQQVASE